MMILKSMMQNLLSQQEKSNLKNGYKKRLIIVFAWAVFFSFLLSSVIFIPAFTMIAYKMGDVNRRVETNSSAIKEQNDILLLPKDINEKSRIIISFKNKPSVSQKIEKLTLAKDTGISLTDLSYKKNDKADPNQNAVQIFVSGVAKDRESLLAFQKTLKDMDFVKDVSVPVSSFAKDNDLPFTITIDLASN